MILDLSSLIGRVILSKKVIILSEVWKRCILPPCLSEKKHSKYATAYTFSGFLDTLGYLQEHHLQRCLEIEENILSIFYNCN